MSPVAAGCALAQLNGGPKKRVEARAWCGSWHGAELQQLTIPTLVLSSKLACYMKLAHKWAFPGAPEFVRQGSYQFEFNAYTGR